MEPQLVIPIDTAAEGLSSWPRLMRVVAIMTIVFAAVEMANGANAIHWAFQPPPAGFGASYAEFLKGVRLRITVFVIARAVIELVLAAAAAHFLKRGRGHRLMAAAMRVWL